MGQCFDVALLNGPLALDAHRLVVLGHLGAGSDEVGGNGLEVLGNDPADQHVAAGGSCGHHIGAGLDLVGDDAVFGAAELFDPVDLDDVGSGAADIGPQRI